MKKDQPLFDLCRQKSLSLAFGQVFVYEPKDQWPALQWADLYHNSQKGCFPTESLNRTDIPLNVFCLAKYQPVGGIME